MAMNPPRTHNDCCEAISQIIDALDVIGITVDNVGFEEIKACPVVFSVKIDGRVTGSILNDGEISKSRVSAFPDSPA